MRIEVSPYHRDWYIGEYKIGLDLRHPTAHDVVKDNKHLKCCYSLTDAVQFILEQQGWQAGPELIHAAMAFADEMRRTAWVMAERQITLGKMKRGE